MLYIERATSPLEPAFVRRLWRPQVSERDTATTPSHPLLQNHPLATTPPTTDPYHIFYSNEPRLVLSLIRSICLRGLCGELRKIIRINPPSPTPSSPPSVNSLRENFIMYVCVRIWFKRFFDLVLISPIVLVGDIRAIRYYNIHSLKSWTHHANFSNFVYPSCMRFFFHHFAFFWAPFMHFFCSFI